MSLADQANDAGVCWPGVASLVERTCLSDRTVQRALRALEQAGLMVCALGAMKSNRYTLNVPLLKQLEREREAAAAEKEALRQAELDLPVGPQGRVFMGDMVSPQGCHGVTPRVSMGDMVSPQGCHGVTQTVIEPIQIHTPHTPQPSAGGLKGGVGPSAEQPPLLSLADWLEAVQSSGQDAVPPDDEVFDYAAAVELPRAFVALCWREFKRRQLRAGKRQRDWRERFRECVRCSWYGLWLLSAGQEARLSTAGEQAARYWEAFDRESAVEGAEA
ncbi:hypothetical protein J2X21_000860 [Kinneretia asaccharophila]|uniref:Helix-turn-helix domain-containing protein n=2 Tax=Roseateles asaccharophilus TaxID=582607 RepID=A0ABU2A3H8_9BURK|nr:hypothetical protein [Roseateles asaccharophilus]